LTALNPPRGDFRFAFKSTSVLAPPLLEGLGEVKRRRLKIRILYFSQYSYNSSDALPKVKAKIPGVF